MEVAEQKGWLDRVSSSLAAAYEAVGNSPIFREAVNDVRNTVSEVFFGKSEQGPEMGTPMAPLAQDIAQARDSRDMGGETLGQQATQSISHNSPSPAVANDNITLDAANVVHGPARAGNGGGVQGPEHGVFGPEHGVYGRENGMQDQQNSGPSPDVTPPSPSEIGKSQANGSIHGDSQQVAQERLPSPSEIGRAEKPDTPEQDRTQEQSKQQEQGRGMSL